MAEEQSDPVAPEPLASPAPPPRLPPRGAVPPALPPIAPLERRTLRALQRGSRAVEGVLDLHGMRQADAHGALRSFVLRAHAEGRTVILIVTGKGGSGGGDERGVLRRVVPHWLSMPDLRTAVLGFEAAGPRHGGEGALYVRLRRRRLG